MVIHWDKNMNDKQMLRGICIFLSAIFLSHSALAFGYGRQEFSS